MRKIIAFLLMLTFQNLGLVLAEKKFNREVIKLKNPKEYKFLKLDDVSVALLEGRQFTVSCIVYRGKILYYVEVGIQNKSDADVIIPDDFIIFNKPGYSVFRTDTMTAAATVAANVGGEFVPTPPPQVQGTTTTNVQANATTYGNQTYISGTATTRTDQNAQNWANLGNALGNALAARSFYKTQAREMSFSNYLKMFAQNNQPPLLRAGETKIIIATFEQIKKKNAPFEIVVSVGGEQFSFKMKE